MNISKRKPPLSVCMVFYNEQLYIKEAIESVLNQSFENFEFIIVNDGSTDSSEEIVSLYNDSRIRYIRCIHNYIGSLNTAFDAAIGEYIIKMDADDIMHEDRILIQYNYMKSNLNIAGCGCGIQRFGLSTDKWIPLFLDPDEIELQLASYNCFTAPILRRSFLKRNKLKFREGCKPAEDYKLWTEIVLAGGKLANLPRILYYYRIHENQITYTEYQPNSKLLDEIQKPIREYLKKRNS